MSCYGWEKGTITLPADAVPAVKKACREAAVAHREKVKTACRDWWATNKTSSAKKYAERIDGGISRQLDEQVAEDVHQILENICSRYDRTGKAKPRQVQEADLDVVLGTKPNARTTRFTVAGEGHIAFDGRKVHYWSGDNNHQVDNARKDPVGRAFFAALGRVQWTRGTGGTLTGNDEYNTEGHDEGSGANYQTASYPPPAPVRQPARSFSYGGRSW